MCLLDRGGIWWGSGLSGTSISTDTINLEFPCLDLRKTCNGNFRLDAWEFLEGDGGFFMVDGCRSVHGQLTFTATVALGRIEFLRFQGSKVWTLPR